jgi:hypothetical protein
MVLKAVFRMGAERAYHVMMTAHRRGACVIAVYARDVAETKAKEARPRQAEGLSALLHHGAGTVITGIKAAPEGAAQTTVFGPRC